MDINNVIEELRQKYKYIRINNNNTIYDLFNKKLLIIESQSSTFRLLRTTFMKILQSENYAYLLINRNTNELFYIEKYNDWMKVSFERSNKEELYFGKEILQRKINLQNFKEKIICF